MCLVDLFDYRCMIVRSDTHHLSFGVIFREFECGFRDLCSRIFGLILDFFIKFGLIFLIVLHFEYE